MSTRLRLVVTLVLLGTAVLVVIAVRVLGPARQTGEVAVPDSRASAEEVVAAYLRALDAHDCETAEAVSDEEARPTAASWCQDVARVARPSIGDHVEQRPEDVGADADAEVVSVPVTFDLAWRPFHDDGSMPEGRTAWGYWLSRDSPSSPWRIVDQGMG